MLLTSRRFQNCNLLCTYVVSSSSSFELPNPCRNLLLAVISCGLAKIHANVQQHHRQESISTARRTCLGVPTTSPSGQ